MRVKYEVYKITGIGFIDEFLSLIIFGLIMTVFMMIGFSVIAFVCVMLGKIFN